MNAQPTSATRTTPFGHPLRSCIRTRDFLVILAAARGSKSVAANGLQIRQLSANAP